MGLSTGAFILAYLVSNLVGLIMAWTSYHKPLIGRFMYALLFLWAAQFNWRSCRSAPDVYTGYGEFTVFPFYKTFIEGWFSEHTELVVSLIAAGQGLIGLAMIIGRFPARLGAWGAMFFLLAIAPLGMGSAFPATILMALGAYFTLDRLPR